ncbi:MAG: PQQ-binding-like beta-propeller repeat protein, partial [Actinoallomurus sp.]
AAGPAPRATVLATAPPPIWTFTPPVTLTDGACVLTAAGVVLFGAFEGMWGVDARTGRQLWTQDFHLSGGSAVNGSTFIALGGHGRLLTLIDAPTGRATILPSHDDVLAGSVYGVVGDTVFLRTQNSALDHGVMAVDLADGTVRWRFPFTGQSMSGAADQTGVYLNVGQTLIALDGATGRRRWVHDWSKAGGSTATMDIAVAGGRVFGDFGDDLQAIDTMSGKPVWSQHVGKAFDTVFLADTNVIFRGDDLRAYDRATGAARWTLAGPAPLASTGHCAVADGLVAASFGGYSGYAQGLFVAGTDGRGRWARWGPAFDNEDWDAAVSGSSVFATDQRRLYCLRAGS